MKKLLFRTMMVAAMATTLVACKKDETTTPTGTSASQLVGTWDVNLEISKTFSGTTLLATDTTVFGTDLTGTLILNSNGTGTYTEIDNGDSDITNFNYFVSGNTLTSISNGDTSAATFTLNANSLSVIGVANFGTTIYQTEIRYTKR